MAPVEQSEDLLTYEQAAEYLGVGIDAVKAAIQRKALHPVKKPRILNKFLQRGELDDYRAGKLRGIARQRRSEDAPAPSPAPALSPAPVSNPEAVLALVRDMIASGDDAIRDAGAGVVREIAAGMIGQRVATIDKLMGGSAFSDPKALLRSLIA